MDDDLPDGAASVTVERMQALPTVFSRRQVLDRGLTPGQVRHRLRSGAWVTLRRGVFCRRTDHERLQDSPAGRHFLALAAAMVALHVPSWAGHGSARRLLALPTLRGEDSVPTLTVQPRTRDEPTASRRHRDLRILPAGVPATHRTQASRLPCLTAARTVVDTLREGSLADALTVGDAALRAGRTTAAGLGRVVDDCRSWPGVALARRRLLLLDGRRESPLESGSVAFFVEQDLPLPEPQQPIVDADGLLLGRCDFLWRAQRVIGEADGRSKYVDDLPGSPRPNEWVWRERLRHDDFEDAGYEVVRWTDDDVHRHPVATRARILRAFTRAARRFR